MVPSLQAPTPLARPVQAVQEAEVLAVRPLTQRAFALRVARPAGWAFPATQVVSLHAAGERRTLTIASGPARPYLEFVTLRGPSPFKQALAALQPGDRVGLKGPYGRFQLDPSRPVMMLAGHVGVGPFKAMLEHAVDQGLDLRGALLHAHPPGDAPFAPEVAELARALPGLRVERPGPGGLADSARIHALAPPGAAYYLAGAPSEVAAAAGALEPLGLPRERVRVELFAGYP